MEKALTFFKYQHNNAKSRVPEPDYSVQPSAQKLDRENT